MDRRDFAEGLTRIGVALRQPPDVATLGVYYDSLAGEADTQEWSSFCRWAVDSGRWQWFPKVTEVRDALRAFRGESPVEAEAAEAYQRVLEASDYMPEAGAVWAYRSIVERCGRAAAEAFLVAGGQSAFATTWDEAKRRQRFVEAYVMAVRDEPETKLLPAGEVKALPPGSVRALMSDQEIMQRVMDMVGEELSKPREKATVVVATEDRLAVLRRQAEEIQSQEVES